MPHPSPVISPSARTEYQRKMLWKKQFSNPSRAETSLSKESGNSVKVATIGVHEVYEPEELCQDWEEVYVTSAYLVWCPSNKKVNKPCHLCFRQVLYHDCFTLIYHQYYLGFFIHSEEKESTRIKCEVNNENNNIAYIMQISMLHMI